MLTSVVASLWWPGWASALASTAAVLAFNWSFVPPRHTFDVDLQQHALLLLAMLVVNWIIAGLVVRLRQTADAARLVADREARLRAWSDTLRDATGPGRPRQRPAHCIDRGHRRRVGSWPCCRI